MTHYWADQNINRQAIKMARLVWGNLHAPPLSNCLHTLRMKYLLWIPQYQLMTKCYLRVSTLISAVPTSKRGITPRSSILLRLRTIAT
eukprot:1140115-Pelagomonas_calceolata.AAC.15